MENELQDINKTKKRLHIFIICGAILAALILAVVFILYFTAPEQRLVRAVKGGNFDTAYAILTAETVKSTDKAKEAARQTVDDIFTRFNNGDINFQEALDKLDALEGTPGSPAAADAINRIETILENEYGNNLRTVYEETDTHDYEKATAGIKKAKEALELRSGYKDSDLWREMLSSALEGDAAGVARFYLTITDTEETAYPDEDADYPTCRREVGKAIIDYALTTVTETSDDDKASANHYLQSVLVDSILNDTAPNDYSSLFEDSNYANNGTGLSSLDLISGTEGSGKILSVVRSNRDSIYGKEYSIAMQKDDGSPIIPLDRFPESIDDVEYILLSYYDSALAATFSDGTRSIPGYQSNGYVSVIHVPTGKVLYTSDVIWGPNLGNSYYVYNSTSNIYGDKPDLSVFSNEVFNALGIEP